MHDITVRQMAFEFPEEMDPVVIPGEPEESYGIVAVSLLLPYLEPYMIRTMKLAKKEITDPELVKDLEAFNGQEGQHFRQHIRCNDAIRNWGEFPGLRALEEELDADYRRFSETKSLRWNLAYAEGFEAIISAAAIGTFEMGTNPDLHPVMDQFLSWHLIEELEHHTVTFDVFSHIVGSYPYRLLVGTWGQWHMLRWLGRTAKCLMSADPRMETEFGGAAGAKERNRRLSRRAMKHQLPRILKTYLPWYTPHDYSMTGDLKQMAADYTEMAVHTS